MEHWLKRSLTIANSSKITLTTPISDRHKLDCPAKSKIWWGIYSWDLSNKIISKYTSNMRGQGHAKYIPEQEKIAFRLSSIIWGTSVWRSAKK